MRQRWLSRRALVLHLALVVWFPGCLIAFWWQVHRALSGNGLSYLYSVEWPAFAVTGVWAWWGLVHTDPATVGRQAQVRLQAAQAGTGAPAPAPAPPATSSVAPAPPAVTAVRRREEEDDELRAYNDRLAELSARGPKTWRSR